MSGASYGGDEVGAVVVDIGSSTVRVGYAGYDSPIGDFPSVASVLPHLLNASEDNNPPLQSNPATNSESPAPEVKAAPTPQAALFGSEWVNNPRPKAEIVSLLKDGLIEDWDMFERLMAYIYKRHLNSDSVYHPILLTEPAWNTKAKREKTTEIMFEKFNVPAYYLAKSAMLSAFANGRASALVLDSGAGQTSAVPVYDGYVMTQAVTRSPLAGDFLNMESKRVIQDLGIEIVPSYQVATKENVGLDIPAKWTKRQNLSGNFTYFFFELSKFIF